MVGVRLPVPTVVLDTQHHGALGIVLPAEGEVLGLEEVSSVGPTRRLLVVCGGRLTHHGVPLAVEAVVVAGVGPESALGREGDHGVGGGASQQRLQSVPAGGPGLVVAGHVAPLVVQSVAL